LLQLKEAQAGRRCNGFLDSSDYIVKKINNLSLSRMKTHVYRWQIFE